MSGKLLYLSDNARNAELLAEAMELHGIQVVTGHRTDVEGLIARNGVRAALVDFAGPEASAVQTQLAASRIPFVLLATASSEALELESVRCGARGILIKPVRPGHLVDVVRVLLGLEP